jgi:hypothetical protein
MNADAEKQAGRSESHELEGVAEKERKYLYERLKTELKREPTEEELNEWLRQHTEGY